jgi:hypothetical protein
MQISSGLTGSGAVRDRRGITSRTSSGQLVQGVTHRIGSLVTVGGDTLADRAALQGDEPWVDADCRPADRWHLAGPTYPM